MKIKFDVIDHSAERKSISELANLYADIRKDNINGIHYDWLWFKIEPQRGIFNREYLRHLAKAGRLMVDEGLEPPTVILSNAPSWARDLYLQAPSEFFVAYRQFLAKIVETFFNFDLKIQRIQVLNELNNTFYSPVEPFDSKLLFYITREVFNNYSRDIRLIASFVIGNITEAQAKLRPSFKRNLILKKIPLQRSIYDYLSMFKEIDDFFDVISLNYYPGVWHFPIKDSDWSFSDSFKELLAFRDPIEPFSREMVRQMDFLKKILEEVSFMGKEYEIGEVGFPTHSFWGDEKRQVFAYESVGKGIKDLMTQFGAKGLRTISRITFFSATNDVPQDLAGKILRLTPYPEYDWGMRNDAGDRKLILQGNPSRLSKLIEYIND